MPKQSTSELTGEFWKQAQAQILVRPVCRSCGENFFIPQVICPSCHSDTWNYQESSGAGSIYSYTVIHRPPDPSFPSPLFVADIELDEGWRMFSWIVDSPATEIEISARVKVTFIDFEGRSLPVFKLIRENLRMLLKVQMYF